MAAKPVNGSWLVAGRLRAGLDLAGGLDGRVVLARPRRAAARRSAGAVLLAERRPRRSASPCGRRAWPYCGDLASFVLERGR